MWLVTPVVSYMTGMLAALGVVTALLARRRGAPAQRVEVSGLAGALALNSGTYVAGRDHTASLAQHGDPRGVYPTYGFYPTGDGWLFVGALTPAFWVKLAGALGREDLLAHPQLDGSPMTFGAPAVRALVRAELEPIFAQPSDDGMDRAAARSRRAVRRRGIARRLPARREARALGHSVPVDDPVLGLTWQPGPPATSRRRRSLPVAGVVARRGHRRGSPRGRPTGGGPRVLRVRRRGPSRRRARPRPHQLRRRARLPDAARRSRRRRGEDRDGGGRPVPHGSLRFRRLEPRQALPGPRPEASGGSRRFPRPGPPGGCGGGELPRRRDGPPRHRLGPAPAGEPAPALHGDHGLRPVRPAGDAPRLRPGVPGALGPRPRAGRRRRPRLPPDRLQRLLRRRARRAHDGGRARGARDDRPRPARRREPVPDGVRRPGCGDAARRR